MTTPLRANQNKFVSSRLNFTGNEGVNDNDAALSGLASTGKGLFLLTDNLRDIYGFSSSLCLSVFFGLTIYGSKRERSFGIIRSLKQPVTKSFPHTKAATLS
ncbi:hypothetical protein PROFUN_04102 [Planoprotostelium fungivorum]|uniref:Uncharacterized protein n=1 Tax=Planoprotostelium fungivorum TaxID=1890364 RepID=A0A2P6NJI8_9EUKA|nr:hypothetical protein PROFUN_04102 [Planoprotostelium fungivorum]